MRRMIIQKSYIDDKDVTIESDYDFFDFSYTFDRIGDMVIGNVAFKINRANAGNIVAGDPWFKISGIPEADLEGLNYHALGTLVSEQSKVTSAYAVMFGDYNEGYPVVSGNNTSFNYKDMQYSISIVYKVKQGE